MNISRTEAVNQPVPGGTGGVGNKSREGAVKARSGSGSEGIADSYQPGDSEVGVSGGYTPGKMALDSAALSGLLPEIESIQSTVELLVRDLLDRQGIHVSQLQDGQFGSIGVDRTAQRKAQELIGPGGELSPEKVSDRIVAFATGAFGGDRSKIAIIRSSIDQGFGEAERILGQLADVSKETYTLIQEKLNRWVNDAQDAGEATESGNSGSASPA